MKTSAYCTTAHRSLPPPPPQDMEAAVKTSANAQIAVCQNRVALCPARTPSGSRNLFTAGGVKSGSAHGARAPMCEWYSSSVSIQKWNRLPRKKRAAIVLCIARDELWGNAATPLPPRADARERKSEVRCSASQPAGRRRATIMWRMTATATVEASATVRKKAPNFD